MKAVFYTRYNDLEKECQPIIIKGLQNVGYKIEIRHYNQGYTLCDVPVMVNIPKVAISEIYENKKKIWNQYQKENIPILVVELGIFREIEGYSLGFNGIKGEADYKCDNYDDSLLDRMKLFIDKGLFYSNWHDGDTILIIGQVARDSSVQHLNHEKWVEEITKKCIELYGNDYRIVFRPHPYGIERNTKYSELAMSLVADTTLKEELERAALVVIHNSTAQVESLLAGCRTLCCDQSGSMFKYPLTLKELPENIEEIEFPSITYRINEFAKAVHYQWSSDEIQRGLPFNHLGIT